MTFIFDINAQIIGLEWKFKTLPQGSESRFAPRTTRKKLGICSFQKCHRSTRYYKILLSSYCFIKTFLWKISIHWLPRAENQTRADNCTLPLTSAQQYRNHLSPVERMPVRCCIATESGYIIITPIHLLTSYRNVYWLRICRYNYQVGTCARSASSDVI